MADLITGSAQQAPKPTALDFLGREAPIAFEGKAALPTGGPGLGVSAGPATVSGSGVAPVAPPSPAPATMDPEAAALMAEAERFLAGGGGTGGTGETGATGLGTSVSGIDANAIGLALSTMGTALGIPGIASIAEGLVTGIPTTAAVPNAVAATPDTVNTVAKGLQALGLFPENEVTMNTPQGPVQGVAVNTPTGLLGIISAIVNTIAGNNAAPGIAVPDVPNPTGIPSEHSPDFTVSPPGIGPAAGYTDPSSVVGVSPAPGAGTGPAPGAGTGGPGAGSGGGAPGAPGAPGAGGEGGPGPGTGESP